MPSYALLLRPSGNRVYSASAAGLAVAEAKVLLGGDAGPYSITSVTRAGVPQLQLDGPEIDGDTLARLSMLSGGHALFELVGDLLRPIALDPPECYDDDLATIPKYRGKTNEQFTRLLLNLTATTAHDGTRLRDDRLRVLDPMCGRGTTLNQALLYGWQSVGVETERSEVDAYAQFLRTWLERKRLKHSWSYQPVRRDRAVVARHLQVSTAPDPQAWKAGRTQGVDVWQADTRELTTYVGPRSVDVVVTDLPYGVQHGSRGGGGRSRGPLELLREALPGWLGTLRPGGAVGLAWNDRVARRDDLLAVLTEHGLLPREDAGLTGLAHRVDQAIVRDLVVARRA